MSAISENVVMPTRAVVIVHALFLILLKQLYLLGISSALCGKQNKNINILYHTLLDRLAYKTETGNLQLHYPFPVML